MGIQTPEWVKNAVFYQIFPDRFARSTAKTNYRGNWKPSNLEPWEASPGLQTYKGGNLWGIADKLDYLQDLGINAIYLTPIFQSTCNHRYHTHDYYQVDPLLGGNVAFAEFLKQAQRRKVKVVLDGVFNHVGRGFFYFNDILENGPHSPWLDWFKIERWPLSAYDGSKPANYVSWFDNRALPQFNHDNPQVREYIMQVGEYWLEQGIDGWRLDVADRIKTPGFWQEFRSRVKGINPDAYIVGEIWEDAREWLDGTQFDGVMNYLFTEATIAFCAGDRIIKDYVELPPYHPYPPLDAAGYQAKIEHLLSLYPWEITLTQLNLLASHDTARVLTIAGGDIDTVKLATLLLFTFPGAPCIYYGDEVGLPGGLDPDCRRSFPNQENWNLELWQYHRTLIALRHQHPALRAGSYRALSARGGVYAFSRTLEGETLIVALNVGRETASAVIGDIQLPFNRDRILFGEAVYNLQENDKTVNLELSLLPRSGVILKEL